MSTPERVVGSWVWALQDPLGQTLSVLSGAGNRHLSFKRSATPSATFKLDLEHDDAAKVQAALLAGGGGLPRLRCFRLEEQADDTLLAVCRFGGIINPLTEAANAGTMTVTANGAFDVLEGRVLTDLFALDATPAGDAAVDLIALAELDGPTGLVIGDIELTEARDVTLDERKGIADAILDLTDAFDFEVVPVADETGQGFDLGRFTVWVEQGADRPEAVFGYGAGTVGNCADAERTTTLPRNRVYVTGDEGLVGFAEDIDSQDRFGVWTYVESMSDVLNQGILDYRAENLLRPTPMQVVTFTPNPALIDDDGDAITPRPGLDYWLGDSVPLSVRKGAFTYDGYPRVDGIDIDIDDEGLESTHRILVATEVS